MNSLLTKKIPVPNSVIIGFLIGVFAAIPSYATIMFLGKPAIMLWIALFGKIEKEFPYILFGLFVTAFYTFLGYLHYQVITFADVPGDGKRSGKRLYFANLIFLGGIIVFTMIMTNIVWPNFPY